MVKKAWKIVVQRIACIIATLYRQNVSCIQTAGAGAVSDVSKPTLNAIKLHNIRPNLFKCYKVALKK